MAFFVSKIGGNMDIKIWYHGSPYSNVTFGTKRTTFFTKSFAVAIEYAQSKIAFASKYSGIKCPTVYVVVANVTIFDMRIHSKEYESYRTLNNGHIDYYGSKEQIPKLNCEGFLMSQTGLPSYGRVYIFETLLLDKYDAMYIDEGSHQGISMAVFDPRNKIKIVKHYEV